MGFSEIFKSPSSHEVWSQLAKEIGGQYWEQPADYNDLGGNGRTVLLTIKEWTIWLEAHMPRRIGLNEPGPELIHMRAPYEDKDGFRFMIFRKHFLTGVEKFLGMQDIEIGEPDFDDEFVIKGNDEVKVRALFADPRLRQLIQSQPYVSLQNGKSEILPGSNSLEERAPRNELYFPLRYDQSTDIARLRSLFELFTGMLTQLRSIGSA
jgi:hypothetical protein